MEDKREWLATAASLYLPKTCRLHARFRPASYTSYHLLLVPKRRPAPPALRTRAIDLQATSRPVSCELAGDPIDATRRLMNSFFSIAVAYISAQAPHELYGELVISIPFATDTLDIHIELDEKADRSSLAAIVLSLQKSGRKVEYFREFEPEERASLHRTSLIEALDPEDHDAAIEIFEALKTIERPWRGRYDYRIDPRGVRHSGAIECRFEKLHWEHAAADTHVHARVRELLPKRQKR